MTGHRRVIQTDLTKATVYGLTPDPASRVFCLGQANLEDAFLNVMCGTITIGDGTFFGHRVMLLTGSHNLDDGEIAEQGRDIVIGKNVWIASGAIILGPCQIGDGAVIGAGSVVTKDCEPGFLYAGNPARKIRATK